MRRRNLDAHTARVLEADTAPALWGLRLGLSTNDELKRQFFLLIFGSMIGSLSIVRMYFCGNLCEKDLYGLEAVGL